MPHHLVGRDLVLVGAAEVGEVAFGRLDTGPCSNQGSRQADVQVWARRYARELGADRIVDLAKQSLLPAGEHAVIEDFAVWRIFYGARGGEVPVR